MSSIADAAPQPPKALLVVSAHWEASSVCVNTGAQPELYYDYNGFPPESYELKWPAPGSPETAERAAALLQGQGIEVSRNDTRGFDHGTFIPLLLAYPGADVPVVQLSLKAGLDPAEHIDIGCALAPLRDEGVMIIGSGNSYHNMQGLLQGGAEAEDASQQFDAWLTQAVCMPRAERNAALSSWSKAPKAKACHPREEHLIPLMVAVGAAGEDLGRVTWRGTMNGMTIAAHQFG